MLASISASALAEFKKPKRLMCRLFDHLYHDFLHYSIYKVVSPDKRSLYIILEVIPYDDFLIEVLFYIRHITSKEVACRITHDNAIEISIGKDTDEKEIVIKNEYFQDFMKHFSEKEKNDFKSQNPVKTETATPDSIVAYSSNSNSKKFTVMTKQTVHPTTLPELLSRLNNDLNSELKLYLGEDFTALDIDKSPGNRIFLKAKTVEIRKQVECYDWTYCTTSKQENDPNTRTLWFYLKPEEQKTKGSKVEISPEKKHRLEALHVVVLKFVFGKNFVYPSDVKINFTEGYISCNCKTKEKADELKKYCDEGDLEHVFITKDSSKEHLVYITHVDKRPDEVIEVTKIKQYAQSFLSFADSYTAQKLELLNVKNLLLLQKKEIDDLKQKNEGLENLLKAETEDKNARLSKEDMLQKLGESFKALQGKYPSVQIFRRYKKDDGTEIGEEIKEKSFLATLHLLFGI